MERNEILKRVEEIFREELEQEDLVSRRVGTRRLSVK